MSQRTSVEQIKFNRNKKGIEHEFSLPFLHIFHFVVKGKIDKTVLRSITKFILVVR